VYLVPDQVGDEAEASEENLVPSLVYPVLDIVANPVAFKEKSLYPDVDQEE
jgi:hypothetical protein